MALADRLAAGPTRKLSGPACIVGALLGRLPNEEAGALRSMLDDESWPTATIREALEDEGHRIGRGPLGRHRAGLCTCAERGLR